MFIIPILSLAFLQSPSFDPQAVLEAANSKVAKAKSVSGVVSFPAPENGREGLQMRFVMEKPNRFVTYLGPRTTICDGTLEYVTDDKTMMYDTFKVVPDSVPRFCWGLEPFFPVPAGTDTFDPAVAGTFQGKTAAIAEFHNPGLRTRVHIAFDPETKLPLGYTLGADDQARDYVYKDLKVDVQIDGSTFAFNPGEKWTKKTLASPKMLPVGSKVADFTIPTPHGGTTTLSKVLAGKKGMLLNFWFVSCNPCRQEFPHLQAMYPGLHDQGFVYLSVNQGDSSESVNKFIAESQYTFPVGLNGKKDSDIVDRFGVTAFPTNYIIGPDRTVVARFVGFDEEGLKTSIRKLGLKLD